MAIKAVCFDLGGVLAHICHNWDEVLASTGITPAHPHPPYGRLQGYQLFDPYQADEVSLDEYLVGLGEFLGGLNKEDALSAHNGIIVRPYDDTDALIADLTAKRIVHGCMSNTNATHWEKFNDGIHFPAIAALKVKLASHLVGINKPDERIFRVFEHMSGAKGAEVAYFDDAPENVEAALKVGWQAKQIDPAQETAPQMRAFLDCIGC